jgi:hypothetical protein
VKLNKGFGSMPMMLMWRDFSEGLARLQLIIFVFFKSVLDFL